MVVNAELSVVMLGTVMDSCEGFVSDYIIY